jgi:hypothetical protein
LLISLFTFIVPGLVILVAALAPGRRLLALATSFGLLLSIAVAMVICSVMLAQQGPGDEPQRFFSWPWFLLVYPLFAYPRAVFVLMAYGTQSGTAPFTHPSEAAVEVYIVVALLFAVGTLAGVLGVYFFAVLPAQVRPRCDSSAPSPPPRPASLHGGS